MNSFRTIAIVFCCFVSGFAIGTLVDVYYDGSLATDAQRRRECAAICRPLAAKTADRVCRCADGKVTVLP